MLKPTPQQIESARLRANRCANRVPVWGVVGGIGAGKSWVARMLAGSDGSGLVVDADRLGHHVLQEPEVQAEIMARLGPALRRSASSTDTEEIVLERPRLAALVFGDERARRELEAILHPRIRSLVEQQIDNIGKKIPAVQQVILDAALLFEAGWNNLCDLVIFVDCPADLRWQRIRTTRPWTHEQLRQRESAQWSLDWKRSLSDRVVTNGGNDLESLSSQLAGLRSLIDVQGSTVERPLAVSGTALAQECVNGARPSSST